MRQFSIRRGISSESTQINSTYSDHDERLSGGLKRRRARDSEPSLTGAMLTSCDVSGHTVYAVYLLMIETPTFWNVVICSSTAEAPPRLIVSVIIDFGLSFLALTICSIEG